MNNPELFWSASVSELKKGFKWDLKNECFRCIFCDAVYEKGQIFQENGVLTDAEKTVKTHIQAKHGSAFEFLMGLDKKQNGLSEIQKEVLLKMYQEMPDNEIAASLDNKSSSTVRNHRFILREKYKEAKLFMAIMELFEEKMERPSEFVQFHPHLTVKDDRTMTTENEKKEILNKYFKGEKMLKFPKKQKEKLIVLQKIASLIDKEKKYNEKEINLLIAQAYSDYVTIRRYLIDYGFLERKADGSSYWLKG